MTHRVTETSIERFRQHLLQEEYILYHELDYI